jgi:hypothetical protein
MFSSSFKVGMTIETELARAEESVMQSFFEIEFQRSTFDGRTQSNRSRLPAGP